MLEKNNPNIKCNKKPSGSEVKGPLILTILLIITNVKLPKQAL